MTNNFHKIVLVSILNLFKGTTLKELVTSNSITTDIDSNCSCDTLQDCSNCKDNEEDK